MEKRQIKLGRKKYVVYLDTDDPKRIKAFVKELRRQTRWWKFNKYIIVPKGVVEFFRL